MKNGKRAVSFILAVVLLCTSFAGCGMVQQDKAYLEQVAAAVTETRAFKGCGSCGGRAFRAEQHCV